MPDPKDVFANPEIHWDFITSRLDTDFEGQNFDRKQAGYIATDGSATRNSVAKLQEEIVQCVSAFANSEGGLIVVGVSKQGEISGINHLQEHQLQAVTDLSKLLRNQLTKLKYVECQNAAGVSDRLLLIYVSVCEHGICETLKSPAEAWIRNGSMCEPITQHIREVLYRERRIVDFERSFCCDFDPNDIDHDVLHEFRQSYAAATGTDSRQTEQDFLYQIGAICQGS